MGKQKKAPVAKKKKSVVDGDGEFVRVTVSSIPIVDAPAPVAPVAEPLSGCPHGDACPHGDGCPFEVVT